MQRSRVNAWPGESQRMVGGNLMTVMTRRAVAAGSRSKVQTGSGDGARWVVMALDRVNSRSPSSPLMRPNPESPTPP